MSQDARQLVEHLCSSLSSPIQSIDDLAALLGPPLCGLGLVDQASTSSAGAHSSSSSTSPWTRLTESDRIHILKNSFAAVQKVILTEIAVNWSHHLRKENLLQQLWTPYFCPNPSGDDGPNQYARGLASLSAYTTLLEVISGNTNAIRAGLSSTTTLPGPVHPAVLDLALSTLEQLASAYGLNRLYSVIFHAPLTSRQILEWQTFVNQLFSVPAKCANLESHSAHNAARPDLEWTAFLTKASNDYVALISASSVERNEPSTQQAFAYVMRKLARSGFLTPTTRGQSFWKAVMPTLRSSLLSQPNPPSQSRSWQSVMQAMTTQDLASISASLFLYVDSHHPSTSGDVRRTVQRDAILICRFLGQLKEDRPDLWDVVVTKTLLQAARYTPFMARVLVAWAMQTSQDQEASLARCLERVAEVWCTKETVERGSLSHHFFLSTALVLLIKALPRGHPALLKLSRSSSFLTSITHHLGALRPEIRMSGMFIAETVSKQTLAPDGPVKPLDFSDIWEAGDDGSDVVAALRETLHDPADWLVQDWQVEADQVDQVDTQPKGAEVKTEEGIPSDRQATSASSKIQVLSSDLAAEYSDYDSEEEPDLVPYNMPSGPISDDLKDLEDPSAFTPQKKKVRPPVYLADLGQMLKSNEDAEKLKVALDEAEGLIRRKSGWGTELADNAVDLAITLAGLQDNFDLQNFEDNRRRALTALVACCPVKTAPCLIEQYFSHQYSHTQRFAILSSLAIASRQLAGLPSLEPSKSASTSMMEIDAFPTDRLPPALHQHFAASQPSLKSMQQGQDPQSQTKHLDAILDGIADSALTRTRSSAENHLPEVSKQKLLTVQRKKRGVLVDPSSSRSHSSGSSSFHYADLAADTFIMPLLNRFWLYLRDVATSPQDRRLGTYQGGSAGTAALLDPMLLSKYLSTLAVLVNAARNSPHFLAILAPETLEVVLALRGMEVANDSVQRSMLHLVLVTLEASIDADNARTLARDFSKTVWQIKDWAEETWNKKEQSGGQIDPTGRAAAGVLLRLDEVVRKSIGYV